MTINVLVLDTFAASYQAHLLERFPALEVQAAMTKSNIGVDPATIDVLVAFGIAIDEDLIGKLANVKWIQSLATGVDHFLACPSLRRETILTSARGIHGPPMRETVAYLMLASARDAGRLHNNQLGQRWDRGQPWTLLAGKTAVIVGVGVSTTAIAQLLKAFGMHVIGISATPRTIEGFDEIWSTERLLEAAARADYLINVLPGGPKNRDRIGAATFAAMKPTARFVNVGRGETVDEAALIEALRSKRIAAAALDVFGTEPLAADNPLWSFETVIVTPHIAGYVAEYEALVMPILVENMEWFLAGRASQMRNIIA